MELAALSDQDAIGRAALAALGARHVAGSPLAGQLAVELGDDPSLVVLDNCEHLIARVRGSWPTCCRPESRCRCWRRAANRSASPARSSGGCRRCAVPARSWPFRSQRSSQFDAVRLFLDRAHRARPSFTVSDDNAPAIAQICHRLDGIPLAIELAAARCRQTSAERIAADLDDRFRYLTGGARTVMPRQQTLAASVDWSYERLDDAERTAFRRLGVFAGPFPLEAAEAVVASAR